MDLIKNKKITKASGLKVVQLVFVKDHQKGTFDPAYIFDHRVSGMINNSTDMLTPQMERRSVTSIISSQEH